MSVSSLGDRAALNVGAAGIICLRGVKSNRQGLGAAVRVHLADGRDLYNHATTAVGYASSSEPVVRFGLGANRVAELVEIRWPGGRLQKLANVEADRIVEIAEEVQPRRTGSAVSPPER